MIFWWGLGLGRLCGVNKASHVSMDTTDNLDIDVITKHMTGSDKDDSSL